MALSGTVPAGPMPPVLQQLPMSLPCLPKGLVALGRLAGPRERLRQDKGEWFQNDTRFRLDIRKNYLL